MTELLVTKADGTLEPFKLEKLHSSLRRAGASPAEIADIARDIERQLTPGIRTETIYRKAFEMLRESEKVVAARYSLRRALFGLGPTGFPFEEYLAKLFEHDGYTTRVGTEVRGNCAPHEIDVLAYKAGKSLAAEAKFHAHPGIKSDLQVALYCYARFLDIKGKKIHSKDTTGIEAYWLVTNTKFTHTAAKYGTCVGLNLLSWDYPKKGNLQQRIEASGLYPITVLQSLTQKDKHALLSQKTVLCKDVINNPAILHSAYVSSRKIDAALEESARLCTIK